MIDSDVFTSSMEIDHGTKVDGIPTAVCTVSVRVQAKDGPTVMAALVKAAGIR